MVWSSTYRSHACDQAWLHWWKLQTIQLLSITLSSKGKLWLQRKWSWYYIKLSLNHSKERVLSKTDHWILYCFVNSVHKRVLNMQPFPDVVKSDGFPVELYVSKRSLNCNMYVIYFWRMCLHYHRPWKRTPGFSGVHTLYVYIYIYIYTYIHTHTHIYIYIYIYIYI